ncbi:MAG: WecB/TagA/CpsF family glycosyltransferase [Candidatus Cloacimonetes bacterium]|nr:WecB/TagA/CpsF family glycosyltransferase [Candidatus Cloacimonadota bacterium]
MNRNYSAILAAILDWVLALFFSVGFTLPVFLIFRLRLANKGKDIFTIRQIRGKRGNRCLVKLFNSKSWLLAHTALFPEVLSGKLALVGVSMRDYSPAPLRQSEEQILRHKPGIISLYFIRSSLRIAHKDRDAIDLEYIASYRGLSKYNLLLKAIPALIYNQNPTGYSSHLEIFGIRMLNMTMQNAISLIDDKAGGEEQCKVFFVNPDCLNKAYTDSEYKQILIDNEIVFPDGIGVTLAGKILGTPLRENVNGTDLFPWLCELAIERNYGFYFLGAAPGIAMRMKKQLESKFPNINICGVHDGYFDWDKDGSEVVSEINSSGACILLVAFGVPIQEKFITRFASQLKPKVLMGVGGLFDFYSGKTPRAPIWMRDIGLEWCFRLMQEPRRMWKRYIIGNPLFIYRVLLCKLKKY